LFRYCGGAGDSILQKCHFAADLAWTDLGDSNAEFCFNLSPAPYQQIQHLCLLSLFNQLLFFLEGYFFGSVDEKGPVVLR